MCFILAQLGQMILICVALTIVEDSSDVSKIKEITFAMVLSVILLSASFILSNIYL